VLTCGSVWACPVCSLKIRARRAADIAKVVAWHGLDRTYMLTLTVRHGFGDDLVTMRPGVPTCWRKVQTGEPWQRFKESVGLRGSIRALEVTHGGNGWHPHLHILLFTDGLSPEELATARAWISERWARFVATELGDQFAPDTEHGCDLRPCNTEDYLAKLGLELTLGTTKEGARANAAPFHLAQLAIAGDADSQRLWQRYCDAFKGARMLTWSKGLRDLAGILAVPTDADLAADTGGGAAIETIAILTSDGWRSIRDKPHVLIAILRFAENGDARALAQSRPPLDESLARADALMRCRLPRIPAN
jgi:hypothetical protein